MSLLSSLLKNLATTWQIEATLAEMRAVADAQKQAYAALEAENAALKQEIADIRKHAEETANRPLRYPKLRNP